MYDERSEENSSTGDEHFKFSEADGEGVHTNEDYDEDEYHEILRKRPSDRALTLRKAYSIVMIVLLVASTAYFGWYLYKYWEEQGKPERSDWAFEETGIDAMNDRGLKGKGIIIGIIDTGVDNRHDDLKNMDIVAWRDYINHRSEPYDDNGHGTHVAGIIGSDGDLKGGAPKASFIICKALDASGHSEDTPVLDSTVGNAINFCVDNGAHIISLSLGGDPTPLGLGSETERATQDALEAGVFVVAAAGNDGGSNDDGDVMAPGNIRSAISVGSINKNLRISSFSSVGDNDGYISQLPDPGDTQDPNKKPEFVAPGEMIVSTYPGNRYVLMSGTSQAVPFVSTALALILEEHPEYKRDGANGGDEAAIQDVKNVLMGTARPTPHQETPHDDHYGYGLIDPRRAVEAL